MAVMVWRDGERERWRAHAAKLDHGREQDDWVRAATGANKLSSLTPPQVPWLIAQGPDASARALLAEPSYSRSRQRLEMGLVAVARFELDAMAYALHEAGESADRLGLLVLPYAAPEAAVLVAGWLRNLGSSRLWARLWLDRHRDLAIDVLSAPGKGKARQNAADALAYLGVPAEPVRTRTVKNPELPELRTRDGRPVPEDIVAHLVAVLSQARLADPPEPPPGDPDTPLIVESSDAAQPMVADRPAIDADVDLAAFGRALFDQWLDEGMPAARSWVVLAQAWVGDDETMAELAPHVRSWPAKSRWARAIDGLAVLASAGTDVSLRLLLAIEERMSGGPTNDRALTYLTQAAARRGLSVPQLADRLAVTHGLDAGIVLDYGPRKFTVRVDDSLTPYVLDSHGRTLAKPPKPGVRDTSPDAYQQFAALKKELRATVSAQVARLERDMLEHRRRPAGDLRRVLHPHPILGPLARRLLWARYDGDGVAGLRIAEDGSFADVHDAAVSVPDDVPVGVVHPAELGSAMVGAWARTFADYEIVQPFPQLGRAAVTLTDAERASVSLPGFGPLPTERIVDLYTSRGWRGNGYETGDDRHTQIAHRLPGGLTLLAEISPGVSTHHQAATAVAQQHVTSLWIDSTWSDHWQTGRRIPLGSADQAALSELLVALRALL